jgi:hypothetical protein
MQSSSHLHLTAHSASHPSEIDPKASSPKASFDYGTLQKKYSTACPKEPEQILKLSEREF